jgi:hypothetical protein
MCTNIELVEISSISDDIMPNLNIKKCKKLKEIKGTKTKRVIKLLSPQWLVKFLNF